MSVTILGLPTGSAAAVTVSGPNAYSQSLTSSQSLTGLNPGVYTVSAADVTVGTAPYQPSPGSQTVAVAGNGSSASASITYSTPTGNLDLTINGLGTSNDALVTVTGPSYNQSVTSSRTLTGLTPGSYTIDAVNTSASCGSTFTVSPTTQSVSVVASTTASASVSYSTTASGTANLCIGGLYVTQSAQNYSGTVPLVQGRAGLLRVFAVADKANAVLTDVQVRFYIGGALQSTVTLSPPPGMTGVPTAPDESSLNNSWNYDIPAGMIQPGFRVEATVNPTGLLPDGNTGDNNFVPAAPVVTNVPTLNVTFVPIMQKGIPAGRRFAGNVTDVNKAAFLATTGNMHPISSSTAVVHAPYTTTTLDTLQWNNANSAWGTILNEIDVLQTTEGTSRYYYGVAKVSYGSGVAGVAYVSNPGAFQVARAALGWDYIPSGSIVAAHELGHNWARNHAPCGGPTGVDLSYPQADGTTGGYGYDLSTGTVEPPSSSDIMGYCDPKWISEYTYSAVLNYLSTAPFVQGLVASTAVQPCLVVWGHVRDGEVVLEPAFQVATRPRLPVRGGSYSLEGKASDGSPVFSLSFAPSQIADAPGSQQNFAYAVPLSSGQAARLTSLQVRGGRRPAILGAVTAVNRRQPASQSQALEVRRVGTGTVGLRWDVGASPMIMVRDPETGEVLSLARGGDVEIATHKRQVDLVISDGVTSKVQRVAVAP
jgi:hypothetical protein